MQSIDARRKPRAGVRSRQVRCDDLAALCRKRNATTPANNARLSRADGPEDDGLRDRCLRSGPP
jgi:hypothetical protein